jgi:hypothetical protein
MYPDPSERQVMFYAPVLKAERISFVLMLSTEGE